MNDSRSKYSGPKLESLSLENGESIFSSSESVMSEKSTTGQSLAGAELIIGESVDLGVTGRSQKVSLDASGESRGLVPNRWLWGSSWIAGAPTMIGS